MGYTGEPTIIALDLHPYTPEATYKLLSDYGEAGRRATILAHLLFDIILPVPYTLFFSSSFTLLGRVRDSSHVCGAGQMQGAEKKEPSFLKVPKAGFQGGGSPNNPCEFFRNQATTIARHQKVR